MAIVDKRRVPAIVNTVCFAVVFMTTAVFFVCKLDPVHHGFFCDDHSIRYPYKPQTISTSLLVLTSVLPVILLIPALEITYGILANMHRSTKDTSVTEEKRGRVDGLKTGLVRTGVLFIYLFYGNILCYCVTEVFKLTFGLLRPSFLAACQPETDMTLWPNCTGLWVAPEDVVCTNPDKALITEMRKAFVSGHASFAAYNMLFIILYLQRRLPSSTPRMVVSFLQSLALSYAVFVMATRIVDHYHYLQDILWGAVLGVAMCWLNFFKLCPRYSRHPPRTELDLLPFSISSTNNNTTTTTKSPKQGRALTITSIHTKE